MVKKMNDLTIMEKGGENTEPQPLNPGQRGRFGNIVATGIKTGPGFDTS